jgi:hypothetical protein
MRIRGGGPTGTGGVGGAGGARGAKDVGKTEGTKFSGLVDKAGDATSDGDNQKRRSAMLAELEALARELHDGNATKEEVSRKFVGMVIRDRFGDQKGKGAKKMEESISEMVENDPNFVARLQNQLKRMART